MRIAYICLLLAGLSMRSAYGLDDLTAFPLLQEECVQSGDISFGDHGRWAQCRVVKGRWFATIEFTDFYQVQYCLGDGGEKCAQTAQLIFANRAYTPVGRLMAQRIDPAGTQYDDPVVFSGSFGRVLVLSARTGEAADTQSYYRWENRSWQSIPEQAWMKSLVDPFGEDLSAREPAPVASRAD